MNAELLVAGPNVMEQHMLHEVWETAKHVIELATQENGSISDINLWGELRGGERGVFMDLTGPAVTVQPYTEEAATDDFIDDDVIGLGAITVSQYKSTLYDRTITSDEVFTFGRRRSDNSLTLRREVFDYADDPELGRIRRDPSTDLSLFEPPTIALAKYQELIMGRADAYDELMRPSSWLKQTATSVGKLTLKASHLFSRRRMEMVELEEAVSL